MSDVSSNDDIISLSDVTDRVEGLRGELEAEYDKEMEESGLEEGNPARQDFEAWVKSVAEDRETPHLYQDEAKELAKLEELLEDLCGSGGDHQWEGDWYPGYLVRDSHFKDYAMQTAEEMGSISRDAAWPYTCIDWEQAANELQMDYTSIEFEGVTYWYR